MRSRSASAAARRAAQREDALGRAPSLDEPGEALDEHGRLAGARRRARTSSGPPGCVDGLALGGGQPSSGCGTLRRIGRAMACRLRRPRRRLARRLPARRGGAARRCSATRPTTAERARRDRHARGGRRPHAGDRRGGRGRRVRRARARCTPTGARFTAVSEERGDGRLRRRRACCVVIDPIDGSLNAKRGLPHHALSIAVADGPDDGRRRVRLRARLRARARSGSRGAAAARRSTACRSTRRCRERRTRDGQARGASASSPPTRAGSLRSADALAEVAHRLRAIGTIAVSLCQVAAARFDGMVTLQRLPRGRRRRRRS